jgi:hypothetical protein
MKRIDSHAVGIEQGDTSLFSDFEDGGEMWIGPGPRERRKAVTFSQPFRAAPAVQVAVSLWDVDTQTAMRAELVAQNVTVAGFDIVFRTWADTRVARIRVSWTAIGAIPHEDDWQLY